MHRLTHVVMLVGLTSLVFTGCFQSTTLVSINPDGSGTIAQRTLLTRAAVAQMQQLAAFGGTGSPTFDPISEQQAREAAARLGPGVTLVSSTPTTSGDAVGRDSLYAFADINQVHVDQRPSTPDGVTMRNGGLTDPPENVAFALSRQPTGNAILRITFPAARTVSSAAGGAAPPSPETLAMAKQMFAGMRIAIAVEPTGRLIRTSSPYVDGQKVTLVDLDFDRLLQDDVLVARLQAANTLEDATFIIGNVPGFKVNLDGEVTIEFAPQ